MEKPRVASRAQEFFAQLREKSEKVLKRPPLEVNVDDESAELFLLAQRLRGLRSFHAPARLRARALSVLDDAAISVSSIAEEPDVLAEIDASDFLLAQRLQELRSVHAPARLRARALAPARDWQNARRVVPLAEVRHRKEQSWSTLASRAVAAAALVIFGGFSTYAVSASSLPDSPLYGFKLFAEDIRVATASANDRPQIYVEKADHRLQEAQRLIDNQQFTEAGRSVQDAQKSVASAQSSAAESAQPQSILTAIEDRSRRTQAARELVAQLTTPLSATLPTTKTDPLAGNTGSQPLVAPPSDPQPLVAPPVVAPNPVISAPIGGPDSFAPIAGTGSSPNIAAPASGAIAPPTQFDVIDTTPVPQPTRPTTTVASSPTAATPTKAATATTAAAPATSTAAPISPFAATPAAQPGLGAPQGGFTVIPPR